MMKPVDKSRTGSGELKENGKRSWNGATSESYFKPVEKSGHSGMGNPMGVEKKEMMTPMNYMKAIDKSMPAVPVEPKSWKRKGYAMGMDD
jgi:hypothetical protein